MNRFLARIVGNLQVPQEDATDSQLIDLWLHGRPAHTQRAYRADVERLLGFLHKPLRHTTLMDLQAFADSLHDVSLTSKTRILNGVKSLFSFISDLKYTPMNVGAALRPPKVKSVLASRILTEEQVIRMLDRTADSRDHALIRLLYHCGLRVSEVCNLRWDDVTSREVGGQIAIFGKGDKLRYILMSQAMWDELTALADHSGYVFKSHRTSERLDPSQVYRLVAAAAKRADIPLKVSPHFLRHSHASHSLDRGANINLVRETLGHASLATTGKYTHARPYASSAQYLLV